MAMIKVAAQYRRTKLTALSLGLSGKVFSSKLIRGKVILRLQALTVVAVDPVHDSPVQWATIVKISDH
ncbi:hypothetical protein [Novipirellula aureliae]|uniref:hypothetical protein n=1 Tax=Novipirellula aureliae TaxID=2527966 RepID=UPI0018CDB719|nr:hypothetical protein [Novipirellula aureliae]